MFVAEIPDELLLGLDVLHTYEGFVDLWRHALRLGEDGVWLCSPRAKPRSSLLVVACDRLIPARCEGVAMAELDSLLGAENGLIEPSPEIHTPEGLHSQDSGKGPAGGIRLNPEYYL
jgi:hypothetical protein